jgi:hypothetical protein
MPTELADGLGLRDAPLYLLKSWRIRPQEWFPRSLLHLAYR